MRTFLLLFIVAFTTNAQAQKAYDLLNWGMSQKEVRDAVKTSSNLTSFLKFYTTNILGEQYIVKPVFDPLLSEIEISNRRAQDYSKVWTSNLAKYTEKYSNDELEGIVSKFYEVFNSTFGDPVTNIGYLHPGYLREGRNLIAVWKNDTTTVCLFENYVNAIAYPVVVLITNERADQLLQQYIKKNEEEINRAINSF